MSESERERRDQRYAEGSYRPPSVPTQFLNEWLPRLPRGRALVLACGPGRNALRSAEVGHETDAIDISEVAIQFAREEAAQRDLAVNWRVADIDGIVLPQAHYNLITVIYYTNRALWPRLLSALKPGGALVVAHHLQTSIPVAGPESSDVRYRPQELLEALSDFRILPYGETLEQHDPMSARYALVRVVAYKGDPGF